MSRSELRNGQGALYHRHQMDPRGENPFTVTVWNLIIRVSDHLHAGEINLIEVSEEESAASALMPSEETPGTPR